MIKTRTKANLIRGLADNEGLATQLATYQTRYGDWRELFRSVDRIDQVSKADIRRVANATFVDTNRTIGVIETGGGGSSPGASESSPGETVARTTKRTITLTAREVRDEADPSLRRYSSSQRLSNRADHELEADSHSSAARVQAAAAQAHRTLERHGDLPAGRSRTAADRRHSPHPRRFASTNPPTKSD